MVASDRQFEHKLNPEAATMLIKQRLNQHIAVTKLEIAVLDPSETDTPNRKPDTP